MNRRPFEPYPSLDELYHAAADGFCELASERIASTGRFCVSLSGGSTPRRLYEMLAERDLPWSSVHWFWGDERNVPPDHEQSNYRMVRQALLDRIDPPDSNVHPVPVDTDRPQQAAERYEQVLREYFPGEPFPAWDLALLGMGDDAHTASLFPETEALGQVEPWFVANWVAKFDAYRYTLTAPAINSAKHCWFLVSGSAKRAALQHVLSEERDPDRFPSQLIQPSRWFVTADACPG